MAVTINMSPSTNEWHTRSGKSGLDDKKEKGKKSTII
jgi:hypothetical protein